MNYQELLKKAKEASIAYYNNDNPIMEDPEYDALVREIKAYEAAHPEEIDPNSPTQRVGGTANSSFAKVQHDVPMLSLRDVFSLEEVDAFLDTLGPDTEVSCETKIDGLSIEVDYRDDETGNGLTLYRASTRGDGNIGEDVTENARYIIGIPDHIDPIKEAANLRRLVVRGEVYLPVKEFLRINEENEKTGGRIFANPRNAAAGLLRTKDVNATKNAHLHMFAFNVQSFERKSEVEGQPLIPMFSEHMMTLLMLQDFGFRHVVFFPAVTKEEVHDRIRHIGELRGHLPYWIDGAVIKVNNLTYRKKLGETSHDPKWAVAFKYPPEEKETTVKDIILQTGRTGKITPVAVFDPPVLLAGTRVERATLHNQAIIVRLGVNVGDTVVVRKAAEIIPEVVRVSKHGEKEWMEYHIDEHFCPSCGGEITYNIGCTEQYCTNPDCPAQKSAHFEFFCSRDCMDIRGLGPNLIDLFIEKGWLNELPDIYRLGEHRREMEQLDGFGKKAVDNLLSAIEASKNQSLDRLVKGLGIPGIGRHIGKELAKKYKDIFEIGAGTMDKEGFDKKVEELSALDGVGPVSARAMAKYFREQKHLQMLEEMQTLGVNLSSGAAETSNESNNLSGLVFVITGTLPTMKREEAAAMIEANGGKVASSVSKKTNYLLAGENAGSKLSKAQELGIKVISEEELLRMMA